MRWVNVAIYGAIALLVAVFWGELRWSAEQLPIYLRGHIGAPEERHLVREARRMLRSGRAGPEVGRFLERAVSIDPVCNGVFWLGEYHLAEGRDAEALEQFRLYLEIDPTEVRAYLRAAEVLARQGRPAEARDVLERGLDYFARNRERYWPATDRSVEARFNDKATAVYRAYGDAIDRTRDALAALGGSSVDSAAVENPVR